MALPLYYNWRNLFVRKLSTLLTFLVVSVVVLVLAVLLSFAAGIQASLEVSGSNQNLVVLKPGATAESTSILSPDEVGRLPQTPGLAKDATGNALYSAERCVQISIPRVGPEGQIANVAVRGVDAVAFEVHREARLIEGRMFEAGQLEVIVGRSARERFANLHIGGQVQLGRKGVRYFKVVGVFEASGGSLESEIWAPRSQLWDAMGDYFSSSVLLRLEDATLADQAVNYINGPTVQLEAKRETDYYRELASKTREIVILSTILVSIMATGAVFAVANTMYASVDSRRREIAMLRTLGFSRTSILCSFLIESFLICTTACGLGLSCSYLFSGVKQDFLSDTTWTVLAYELRITPGIILSALVLSVVVALIGAVAPAWKASRTHLLDALRKA